MLSTATPVVAVTFLPKRDAMNSNPTTATSPGIVRDTTNLIEDLETSLDVSFYDGKLAAGARVENFGTDAIVTGVWIAGDKRRDISVRVDYPVTNWIVRSGVKGKKTIGAAPRREFLITMTPAYVEKLGGILLSGVPIHRDGNTYAASGFIGQPNGQLIPNGAMFGKADGEKLVRDTKAKLEYRRPKAAICFLGVNCE